MAEATDLNHPPVFLLLMVAMESTDIVACTMQWKVSIFLEILIFQLVLSCLSVGGPLGLYSVIFDVFLRHSGEVTLLLLPCTFSRASLHCDLPQPCRVQLPWCPFPHPRNCLVFAWWVLPVLSMTQSPVEHSHIPLFSPRTCTHTHTHHRSRIRLNSIYGYLNSYHNKTICDFTKDFLKGNTSLIVLPPPSQGLSLS